MVGIWYRRRVVQVSLFGAGWSPGLVWSAPAGCRASAQQETSPWVGHSACANPPLSAASGFTRNLSSNLLTSKSFVHNRYWLRYPSLVTYLQENRSPSVLLRGKHGWRYWGTHTAVGSGCSWLNFTMAWTQIYKVVKSTGSPTQGAQPKRPAGST